MPKYKVISKGFHDSKLYDPDGKRPYLFTSKPIKPLPSWLEPVKNETAAEKKKRLASEREQLAAEKAAKAADQQAVEELTFIAEGQKASKVETL